MVYLRELSVPEGIEADYSRSLSPIAPRRAIVAQSRYAAQSATLVTIGNEPFMPCKSTKIYL
jgi:hypothetical protein